MSFNRPVRTGTTGTKVVDDSKKKASLLKDNSWIRANVNEDKQVESDPNFGKTVLGRYKSNENLVSPQDKTSKTSTVVSSPVSSVQALSKRFGGSQDKLNETRTIGTKTTVKTQPRTSSTTTIIKDGSKIIEKTVTTTSDYKTEVLTVKSSKDTVDGPTSPVKTSSIKSFTKEDVSPTKTTSYSTQRPTSPVKTLRPTSPVNTSSIKTYTKEEVSPAKTTSYSVRSTKSTEDQLFDTLIPTSAKSAYTKPDASREDVLVSKTIKTTTYSSSDGNEWSPVTSPSYTRTTFTESRPVDYQSDSITSKTSTTVYTTPERTVSAKDICTYCHKNMYTDEKIILDDININCHARCFKCGVCDRSLGHLKAGDNLWVYRRAVYCENCYGVTRGKWIS